MEGMRGRVGAPRTAATRASQTILLNSVQRCMDPRYGQIVGDLCDGHINTEIERIDKGAHHEYELHCVPKDCSTTTKTKGGHMRLYMFT